MTTRSARTRPVHRIAGPDELIQAVPYLLGFHPDSSLVLVGMSDGVLSVTARIDLADAVHPDVLPGTVAALCRGGASEVIALVYGATVAAAEALVAPVRAACDLADCDLFDVFLVAAGRYRSLLCAGPDCCPPGGVPIPADPSSFTAAATVAGVVALPDRAALDATLEPLPAAHALDDAGLAAAEAEAVEAALRARVGRHRRAAVGALLSAARASAEAGWSGPDDKTAARHVVALTEFAVRDEVWLALDAREVDGRPLWRDLARRAPGPYRAAPLFLFGWASWRAGDGALAGMAADRAVAADPGYTAADLLRAALSTGADPRTLPTLRERSSA